MSLKNQLNTVPEGGTVISRDGTIISYLKTGSGPGLILIHGVLSIAANYSQLAAGLAQRFTVYSMERRGRGLSGPQGEDYSTTKECEDLDALQKHTGAIYLFGHSYGGLIALEAARSNKAFSKIAVYEPGVSVDNSINVSWIPDYEKYMAAHQYLDAFAVFSIKAGPENAQRTPLWMMKLMLPLFIKGPKREQMYALMPSNLREHQQIASKNNTYLDYHEITAEVLLMYGGKSKLKWVGQAVRALKEVLPLAGIKEFPTLNHFGPDETGPGEIAQVLTTYFTETI
ncbi:alpha/beta fold hydrolase [Mucilaginibacter sp. X5P1]|uniref:alpha/beta fold hydrolase n=1 Tax=Mucilaginibacter sp. X5P1 TaxID=2723088 RepID=UPI00161A88D2|nr:alpha/beta hydrolase [Mucilaginibacter sp. X5P1]MBB6137244.1 pimeloyl-ACP methyl ester carboxylesterase [Mucilaginibacter sp. X5P1]